MSVWNVFDGDAFSLTSLTAAINHTPYRPGLLGELGLFEEQGITTTSAAIEEQDGTLALVDVAPRNGVGQVVVGDTRTVRSFTIPHLPERATIMADSVQGVRAFGSETGTQTVESVRNARLAKMRANIDYTMESHRLAVVQGNYIDANGASVSLATAFNVTLPTPISFALGTATTKVREKCMDVLSVIEAGLDGTPFTGVTVLCGATFWKQLIEHAALKETVVNWQAAQTLRADPRLSIDFGGLRFLRYRGTSAVKVQDGEAWAIPTGVSGLFITRFAPANYMETVNTVGLPYYAKAEVMPFQKGVQLEAQSNPLNLCTRPASIVKLTAA